MPFALQFNGVNYVEIPDAADLDLNAAAGWTIWFRAKVADNSGSGVDILLDIEDGNFLKDYLVLQIGNASVGNSWQRDRLYYAAKGNDSVTSSEESPAATFPNADFVTYFVSFASDTFYIGWCENGGNVQEATASKVFANILGGRWFVGAASNGGSPLRSGTQIESFGVSTGKMTDAEIEAVAAGTAFDSTTATVARYYPLTAGTGTIIEEASNIGNAAYQGAFTGLSWINLGGGDTVAPSFSVAPIATAITQTTADLDATINELGDIHWVVVPQADAAPSIAEIQAGQSSGGGSPIASGNVVGATVLDTQISALAAGTDYAVYLIAQDDESTPNVQSSATQLNFSTLSNAGTITTGAFANSPDGLQAGLTNLRVIAMSVVDGSTVLNSTGHSTHATTAVLTVSNAALVPGTWYLVVVKSSDGTVYGIERYQAT